MFLIDDRVIVKLRANHFFFCHNTFTQKPILQSFSPYFEPNLVANGRLIPSNPSLFIHLTYLFQAQKLQRVLERKKTTEVRSNTFDYNALSDAFTASVSYKP